MYGNGDLPSDRISSGKKLSTLPLEQEYLKKNSLETLKVSSTRENSGVRGTSPQIDTFKTWNRHHGCCMPDHQQLLRAELNAAKIKIAKLTD
jgi:hypothetical protein